MSDRASIPTLIIDALETYSRDYCFEDSEHAIAIDAFLRGVQPMSAWIDIRERKPPAPGEYLVAIKVPENFPHLVTLRDWNGKKFVSILVVTHWMPKPEPPK